MRNGEDSRVPLGGLSVSPGCFHGRCCAQAWRHHVWVPCPFPFPEREPLEVAGVSQSL